MCVIIIRLALIKYVYEEKKRVINASRNLYMILYLRIKHFLVNYSNK